jgi:hypothetical protein
MTHGEWALTAAGPARGHPWPRMHSPHGSRPPGKPAGLDAEHTAARTQRNVISIPPPSAADRPPRPHPSVGPEAIPLSAAGSGEFVLTRSE